MNDAAVDESLETEADRGSSEDSADRRAQSMRNFVPSAPEQGLGRKEGLEHGMRGESESPDAAACFARASSRVYNWLLNHSVLGPVILEWRRHRSMPYRTKMIALAMLVASFSVSILFFVPYWQAQLALALFGAAMAAWLYRIPSRDDPRRPTP